MRHPRGVPRLSGAAPHSPPNDAAAGLAAALLLARGDVAGLRLVGRDAEAAWASFRAAALCLPVFVGIKLLGWSLNGVPAGGALVAGAAELCAYAITWVGYALASKLMAEQAQAGRNWAHFIAAWNWTNVVQYALLVPVTLAAALGAPGWLSNGLGLGVLAYAVWLEWFVARHALGVAGPAAALFVMLDLALGLGVAAFAQRVASGG